MNRIYKRPYHAHARMLESTAAGTYDLVYQGGPLLTHPEVFVIFLGNTWRKHKNDMDYLQGFFPAVLTSSLMDQLKEYNTSAYQYGYGKYLGSAIVAHTYRGKKISDVQIQNEIKTCIARHKIPSNTAQTLYFVFTPPNIKVTADKDASCTVFCGYHDAIDQQIFYAVIPYPSCNGCLGTLSVQQSLTVTSSHELCEAMTDPIPGNGWYNQKKGESGDFCGFTFKTVNGYTVQQEWSNKLSDCT